MSEQPSRKGGRPRKHPAGVNRPVMSFRVRPDLYEKLFALAAPKGHSLSEQLERIIEAYFDADLIKKAVADGIAAHEAAKREDVLSRAIINADGSWSAMNNPLVQLYRY